jgi:hypothetical protein
MSSDTPLYGLERGLRKNRNPLCCSARLRMAKRQRAAATNSPGLSQGACLGRMEIPSDAQAYDTQAPCMAACTPSHRPAHAVGRCRVLTCLVLTHETSMMNSNIIFEITSARPGRVRGFNVLSSK